MTRKTLAAGALVSTLTLGGCLQKATTHTLYLEPEGAVTWTALEKEVRSDQRNPTARLQEEDDYLSSIAAGTHSIGRALAALGGLRPVVLPVRRIRPFVVVTEVQFNAIDQVINRLLAELQVSGHATLERTNGGTRLLIHADATTARDAGPDQDNPVTALLESPERFQIVLTEGRFVDARGFRLSDDGAVAVPIDISDGDLARTGGQMHLSLTWESR